MSKYCLLKRLFAFIAFEALQFLYNPGSSVPCDTDFDMQVVSDKGDVISTVPCSYEDDCAILDCIDNRQIPECVQDLLLHPQARKIFWNGLVFVEICHKPMETEKGMVCFKVEKIH